MTDIQLELIRLFHFPVSYMHADLNNIIQIILLTFINLKDGTQITFTSKQSLQACKKSLH